MTQLRKTEPAFEFKLKLLYMTADIRPWPLLPNLRPPRTKKNAPRQKPLLKAAFTELVAINFEVSPSILKDKVPKGLELDFYNKETYVSLVCMVVRKAPFFRIAAGSEILRTEPEILRSPPFGSEKSQRDVLSKKLPLQRIWHSCV